MIKQCIGIPDMILLLMIFFVSKKIKIKAEIVLSPGGSYFQKAFFLKSPCSYWTSQRLKIEYEVYWCCDYF